MKKKKRCVCVCMCACVRWYNHIFSPPQSGQTKSILDKDKSAQAILDMAGKTRHSEGLREPEDD